MLLTFDYHDVTLKVLQLVQSHTNLDFNIFMDTVLATNMVPKALSYLVHYSMKSCAQNKDSGV